MSGKKSKKNTPAAAAQRLVIIDSVDTSAHATATQLTDLKTPTNSVDALGNETTACVSNEVAQTGSLESSHDGIMAPVPDAEAQTVSLESSTDRSTTPVLETATTARSGPESGQRVEEAQLVSPEPSVGATTTPMPDAAETQERMGGTSSKEPFSFKKASMHEADTSSRQLCLIHPPKENFKQVRQTKVESSNKPLWDIVQTLQEFFTPRFREIAMPSNIFQSAADKTVLQSPAFMCTHDAFSDGGDRMAPHLVADFTDLSKQIADRIAKYKMQDNEEKPYELIARNADKTAEKAAKKVVKAKKAVAAAAKRLKTATAKTVKSDAKAKPNKSFVKAQKDANDAQVRLNKASKEVAELSQKAVQAWKTAEQVFVIQSDIIQLWENAIAKMKPSVDCVGDDVEFPTCTQSCKLYFAQCTKCKGSKCQCGSRPWLLIYLSSQSFRLAREYFGRDYYVGRHLPREIPKSWTYIQQAWNTIARTLVTEAIEAAVTGDNSTISAEFHLFGSSLKKSTTKQTKSKKKKNQKKKNQKKKNQQKKKVVVPSSVKFKLPASFDDRAYKIAALVDHYTSHHDEPSMLYGDVHHSPSDRERDHLIRLLEEIVTTNDLSPHEILDQHVKKSDAFAQYKGPDWEKWFIQKLEHIQRESSLIAVPPVITTNANPHGKTTTIKQHLTKLGVTDNDIICLVTELCRMVGPATRPFDIIEQWYKVLAACSSHWCHVPLWWCVASTLVMYSVDTVTRSSEGGVIAPATCMRNWDMLAILRLLQCHIFPEKVRQAVQKVNEHTRRDIAHERFDCDWQHSCQCLVELLQSLDCARASDTLQKWMNSKSYTTSGDRKSDLQKLGDLREAWLQYTCPAVTAVATEVLKKACACITIPEKALDLTALANLLECCKLNKKSQTLVASDECPLVVLKPISIPTNHPVKPSKLASIGLSPADLQAMFPKEMRTSKEIVTIIQGLANFLLDHGISMDVIEFVVRVHLLVPPKCKINWSRWLHSPINSGRPPLWWRIIMLILGSAALYYIQMSSVSSCTSTNFSSYLVDIMSTDEYQGQIPNLDIWTWDTAATLQILQSHLFDQNTNQAAIGAVNNCRNPICHFDPGMSFNKGFECIKKVVVALGHHQASFVVQEYHEKVRPWFPAFGDHKKMEQSRLRPLLLTTRQYDAFAKHVLDQNGNLKPRLRLRFQCAASSGKTVIATILAVEFFLDRVSPKGVWTHDADMGVLFITHAPILARRTANDVCDQLTLKMRKYAESEKVKQMLQSIQVKRVDNSEGNDIYSIVIAKQDVIVVATINAALKLLKGKFFCGGVIVDEAHMVYGSDSRKGQTIGQNTLRAEQIAPIVERWGGARREHEAANRLVLFGDERNQSMRRRFTDSGKDLVKCDGCGTQRLSNWIDFTTSFYARVQRIFDVLDVNGNGRLSEDELSSFAKEIAGVTEADFKRFAGFDIETLCLFYSPDGSWDEDERTQFTREKNEELSRHEKLLGTHETTVEELHGDASSGLADETRKLCVHCALVAKARSKGITSHQYFLGDIEDPIFPLENDGEHPDKSMQVIAGGFLDSNYRQPACIADVAASQHTGGGQKGAVQIHHVDSDSVEGRAVRYADVDLGVNMKHAVRRLVNLNATTARKRMQNLTDTACDAYSVALTKELIEATACVNDVKKSKRLSDQPDVLVLAPRCGDDPDFMVRLKESCLNRNSRIDQLTKNCQIQFGTVGEWTGSDSPLVIITGFHQPYHLLTNVGCFGRDHILAASVAEMKKWKKRKTYRDEKYVPDTEARGHIKQHEQQHPVLESRLSEIPVDTLLYIAVTRATWGLSVVEPFAKKFAAHYQIGTDGRALSRAGKPFTAQWSDDSAGSGTKGPKSRVLRNAQVLVDPDSENKSLNMSGKDIELLPKFVLDLKDVEVLNLSVNKLQRLPSDLWNLPLRTLNLSYNPNLGRIFWSILKGASQCTNLQNLCLRSVVGKGGE